MSRKCANFTDSTNGYLQTPTFVIVFGLEFATNTTDLFRESNEVGVDDSISTMTAIFLLPVSAIAPIRDVICSTGGRAFFVHSVDPFLSDLDVSFASEIPISTRLLAVVCML